MPFAGREVSPANGGAISKAATAVEDYQRQLLSDVLRRVGDMQARSAQDSVVAGVVSVGGESPRRRSHSPARLTSSTPLGRARAHMEAFEAVSAVEDRPTATKASSPRLACRKPFDSWVSSSKSGVASERWSLADAAGALEDVPRKRPHSPGRRTTDVFSSAESTHLLSELHLLTPPPEGRPESPGGRPKPTADTAVAHALVVDALSRQRARLQDAASAQDLSAGAAWGGPSKSAMVREAAQRGRRISMSWATLQGAVLGKDTAAGRKPMSVANVAIAAMDQVQALIGQHAAAHEDRRQLKDLFFDGGRQYKLLAGCAAASALSVTVGGVSDSDGDEEDPLGIDPETPFRRSLRPAKPSPTTSPRRPLRPRALTATPSAAVAFAPLEPARDNGKPANKGPDAKAVGRPLVHHAAHGSVFHGVCVPAARRRLAALPTAPDPVTGSTSPSAITSPTREDSPPPRHVEVPSTPLVAPPLLLSPIEASVPLPPASEPPTPVQRPAKADARLSRHMRLAAACGAVVRNEGLAALFAAQLEPELRIGPAHVAAYPMTWADALRFQQVLTCAKLRQECRHHNLVHTWKLRRAAIVGRYLHLWRYPGADHTHDDESRLQRVLTFPKRHIGRARRSTLLQDDATAFERSTAVVDLLRIVGHIPGGAYLGERHVLLIAKDAVPPVDVAFGDTDDEDEEQQTTTYFPAPTVPPPADFSNRGVVDTAVVAGTLLALALPSEEARVEWASRALDCSRTIHQILEAMRGVRRPPSMPPRAADRSPVRPLVAGLPTDGTRSPPDPSTATVAASPLPTVPPPPIINDDDI